MTRWSMLAHATDVRESGTLGQTGLAFDLPGTPAEFLEGIRPGASLDLGGLLLESAAVARLEIAALRERRESIKVVERPLARGQSRQILGISTQDPEEILLVPGGFQPLSPADRASRTVRPGTTVRSQVHGR
jgi:hypothetical protein